MTEPPIRPDRATALRLLDDHDVVPLVLELPASGQTPVSLMQRLGVGGHCFLLESATTRRGVHGYSFLGHDPLEVAPADADDPLRPLETVLAERVAPLAGAAVPFVGGWVGYLGYEAAGCYERLPSTAPAIDGVPMSVFALYRTVTVFDHERDRVLLITQLHRGDDPEAGFGRACDRLHALHARVAAPPPASGAVDDPHAVGVEPISGDVTLARPVLDDGASTFPVTASWSRSHVRSSTSSPVTSSRCRSRGGSACR